MNKQIGEMARLIFDFDEVENNEMKIAKWLYDNGCRIIHEDEIYMSKEEWEQRAYVNAMQNELCQKCQDRIAKETVPVVMYEQARKEMADIAKDYQEMAKFYDEKCEEYEQLKKHLTKAVSLLKEDSELWFKYKFGVEVEE